ncbi:hypothetical protein PRVXT_001267 [Proteinivorax tanatarense]|uniref:Uncharacterized protein n=1 Tax=Proteinivorax tanatarense TaxID=1260629 RepID=A0AAU7VPI1_9FIRM
MPKKDNYRSRFCSTKDLGHDSYSSTEFSHELDIPINHTKKFRNINSSTYSHKRRSAKTKLNTYPSDFYS